MREQIERAYVSTVHAFCARLLRENAIAAAVDPQFQVLDWPLSQALLRESTDEVLESIYQSSPFECGAFCGRSPSPPSAMALCRISRSL